MKATASAEYGRAAGHSSVALACPVLLSAMPLASDQGDPAGIVALLVVTVAVLASVAGFFFIYLRRRIRMFEESNGGSY